MTALSSALVSFSTAQSTNMLVDIQGRIGNIQLSPNRALHPLFEAVANSIHSIQDARTENGRIEVLLERHGEGEQTLFDGSDLRPIVNFTITDNGVGFTNANFESFNKSDSRYKVAAKGIGRFTWLIAFEKVRIESNYRENGNTYRRSFDFLVSDDGIEGAERVEIDRKDEQLTTVQLLGFRERYQAKCEKGLETIADKIIENFLYYFTQENCPTITISDGQNSHNLNELYKNNVKGKNKPPVEFEIKGQAFRILNLQLYLSREKKHTIHYCAHGRAVKNMDAQSRIPDLSARRIADSDGQVFKYAAYVSGDYLDQNVRPERTEFNIPQSTDDLDMGRDEISWDDIQRQTVEQARNFLKPHLTPISESKLARIKKYVETEAPQYRLILRYRPEALDAIKPDLSDAELDLQLHRILFEIESELKTETREVLSKTPADIADLDKYKQNYKRLVETVNDVSKSKLAQHVIHRKLILDLLETFLRVKEGGEYERENVIHQTIFPMRKTSDDNVLYEQQNLWIVDERLTYHRFLASDKALSSYRVLKTKDPRKPDITIFVGETDAPYDSVVIIEFKRPMREGYTDEDPIRKLYEVAKTIRDGDAIDDDGRPIKVHTATRIYCYFICDIVGDQIKDHADVHRLIQAPDGMGYFGYHEPYSTYMEVIDYTKLLSDAKKRNRVFFDKLDLQ